MYQPAQPGTARQDIVPPEPPAAFAAAPDAEIALHRPAAGGPPADWPPEAHLPDEVEDEEC
ncbi:MAG TPA: hypothetical protein VFQ45_01730 [Longimicrobium sp.]|nr:hypothetical protein [Longimicrobium sp.]